MEFSVCLICQKETSKKLAQKPGSHEKVLKRLEEWAKHGDLWSVSVSKLIEKKVSWHRNCSQETVHHGLLERANDRYIITAFVNDGLYIRGGGGGRLNEAGLLI